MQILHDKNRDARIHFRLLNTRIPISPNYTVCKIPLQLSKSIYNNYNCKK